MSTTKGGGEPGPAGSGTHEVIHLEQTRQDCSMCEDYATRRAAKPVAVMSCEGACLVRNAPRVIAVDSFPNLSTGPRGAYPGMALGM